MVASKITYANKTALNENPEIADINKITDDDMNEIKQVVNANADNIDELYDASTYSTTEKVVGTWLGKTLYSKTFTGYTSIGNYNHNIANVDSIWIDEAHTFIKKTTGRVFGSNYYSDPNADYASTSVNTSQILIGGVIANLSTITVTLLYTKTS